MIIFRGLKQITKHLFFLLQISERCPSVCEAAKEEVEEEQKIEEEDKEEEEKVVEEDKGEEEEEGKVHSEEDKEEEIAEAVPSGLKVTSVDHHNQEECR